MSFTPLIIGFLAIIVPGFFLALALLRKTKLSLFEITVIGFIFGLIFPPTMIWLESYLIPYLHGFSFSANLYNSNVVILTIIGIVLSLQQGAIGPDLLKRLSGKGSAGVAKAVRSEYRARVSELRGRISRLDLDMRIVRLHEREEEDLAKKQREEINLLKSRGAGMEELQRIEQSHREAERKLFEEHEAEEKRLISGEGRRANNNLVWALLLIIMVITFASRIVNIGAAPRYFEFDPYFDMMNTAQILTYGYQLQLDHSAWPVQPNGTIHRIEPVVPYIEAYWYSLSSSNSTATSPDTTLLSNVSSFYPPIVAALLVFVIFMFIYHEYGSIPALIAAALAASMPALITAFIAGEQLLEPWGIFTLFFLIAAYVLAVKNPKEYRFAMLAGIAFISTFLGSHYYNVTAGIVAAYILIQGVIDVLFKRSSIDFHKMNAVVLLIIVVFYTVYGPYGSTLSDRIPAVLGIPSIIAFPLFAFAFVLAFDYLPSMAERYRLIKKTTRDFILARIAFLILVLLLILLPPISKSITAYVGLIKHFTTPNTPLFMTVQEYLVTGPNFDFGGAGFGLIGAQTFGASLPLGIVLILFTIIAVHEILIKDSKSSIFSLVVVWGTAIGAMSEIKYLPHFGTAYILAVGILAGWLYLHVKGTDKKPGAGRYTTYAFYGVVLLVVLIEAIPLMNTFVSAGLTCSQIGQYKILIGGELFCHSVPSEWLDATAWMRANVGPLAPRILSWWDYGDWINWFGNSNAVIRGDNAVATLDYATAARFALGTNSSYGPASLASFMNAQQARYVLFDDQLVPKWSALDFLACVHVNQTSRAYAISQGQPYRAAFILGTSQCEYSHDPINMYVPLRPAINDYCNQFSNSSITAVKSIATIGETIPQSLNQTYCVSTTSASTGALRVFTLNGTPTNILLSPALYLGNVRDSSNRIYAEFMAIYLPNGPNNTITNAPGTYFYNSNFYQGFFLGRLKGFTLVYPRSFNGINFINSSSTIMIYQSNNYAGSLPTVTQRPSWVKNNYTIPG